MTASGDKESAAKPAPTTTSAPAEKTAPSSEPSKADSSDKAKAETGDKAGTPAVAYSRGEGQKPVTQAYKDNWNAIYAKKKKKR